MFNIRSLESISGRNNYYIMEIDLPPKKNGILDGLTFAVKDVIDIENIKTSCGNPTWASQQSAAKENAVCVHQLLNAGSRCLGKTTLGEFCSGSTGVNHFYGMPPNPKAPQHVPGGSSSGSAAVVAAELVDFSLGSDAAGSVRIPASFCGIYGFRPSYGIISMSGVKSFAPSFDTVGVFTKDINILERVLQVLMGKFSEKQAEKIKNFYVLEDLMILIPVNQRIILQKFVDESCEIHKVTPQYIKLSDIHPDAADKNLGISAIFRKLLCFEIWSTLGVWIKKVNLQFQKNTFIDFSEMENISKTNLNEELRRKIIYAEAFKNFLTPGNLLCIPTAPDVAPLRNSEFKKVNEFDYKRLRPLISLASIGGLPQINIPLEVNDNPPIGVSLIADFKQDYFLINTVKNLQDILTEKK